MANNTDWQKCRLFELAVAHRGKKKDERFVSFYLFILSSLVAEKVMSRREVRTGGMKYQIKRKSESMLVVLFSTVCLLRPLSDASLAVHVGLWNGVDWMVGFVVFISN